MKKADAPTYQAEIRPRDIPPNPRCPLCKSPDPNGRPAMYHPLHAGRRCGVPEQGGEPCACEGEARP